MPPKATERAAARLFPPVLDREPARRLPRVAKDRPVRRRHADWTAERAERQILVLAGGCPSDDFD